MNDSDIHQDRASEKKAAREKDVADLASGATTREELARKNGAFAFPRSRIRWDKIRAHV